MANGFEKLGQLLGGGMHTVREEAYQEGRLRTAQTENALAQARQRQLEAEAAGEKAKAREQTEEAAIAMGMSPEDARMLGLVVTGESGSDFSAFQQGRLRGQEHDFRSTLADPNATQRDRFLKGQGVQGKVLSPFETVGAGGYVDLTSEEPDVLNTPLGQSMVLENEAQANLYDERRVNPQRFLSGAGATGPRPPANYKINPDFDPELPAGDGNPEVLPITGGPADPNTPGKLGVRERQVIGRVVNAALNTADDMENLKLLPSEASSGFLGTGLNAAPATSIMDATIGQLKYKISPSEVRDYQRILSGLSRQMMTMELMGMQGTEGLTAQFDALGFRKYDTIEDKMTALALMRQTTENALRTISIVNPLSDQQRRDIDAVLARLRAAVPFEPADVLAVRYDKTGRLTLGSAIAARGADTGTVPTIAVPENEGPAAPAEGTIETDSEGQQWQFGGGDPADPKNWYPVAQ